MGELLTIEEPKIRSKEFCPQEIATGDIIEYIERSEGGFKKAVEYLADRYSRQNHFVLFCTVMGNEYKRRLEFLDPSKHKNIAGKIKKHFGYMDSVLKPIYEKGGKNFGLQKQGLLAELAVMKIFYERYGKKVFYPTPKADIEGKIDCVVEFNKDISWLMQIKNYNSLKGLRMIGGDDTEKIVNNLEALDISLPSIGLSRGDIDKMFGCIQNLPKAKRNKYKVVLSLFPFNIKSGQELRQYFDEYGEPQEVMTQQFDQIFKREG